MKQEIVELLEEPGETGRAMDLEDQQSVEDLTDANLEDKNFYIPILRGSRDDSVQPGVEKGREVG